MQLTHRTLSKILVEVHEDKHVVDHDAKARRHLVAQLEKLGVPVERCEAPLPVDLMWTVDGEPTMWDLKTPQDMIASAEDGRLHKQMQSMEERGCVLYGFGVEGDVSGDGVTVGYGTHAWAVERFDNLLLSLQAEGAKIVRVYDASRTASRLAALYRWTGKADRASWRKPKAPSYSLNRLYGDRDYRAAVEALMALFPGCGEERAVALLSRYTMQELLGEGAEKRWKEVRGVGPLLTTKWARVLSGDYRG